MPPPRWKDYFTFTKKQRTGIYILLGIMAVFIFSVFWYKPLFNPPAIDKDVQQKLAIIAKKHYDNAADSLDEETADSVKEAIAASPKKIVHQLFYFDPNTADATSLLVLGFGEKTTEHIIEYRKTKKFVKPEDLYNIPRIRKKVVQQVLPYVKFGVVTKQAPVTVVNKAADIKQNNEATLSPPAGSYKPFNINTATAADFKVFPGVTYAVANRIIKFRNSINGFTSVDDVAKTYGLPDSSFRIMKPFLRLQ